MKRIVTALSALCLVAFFASSGFSQLGGLDPVSPLNKQLKKYTINFGFNESTFSDPKYIKQMDEYAPIIKGITTKMPGGYTLFVVGHASEEGTDEYNQALSANRAKTVYDRLIQAGVGANVMKFEGKGEALNKRVVTFEIRKD